MPLQVSQYILKVNMALGTVVSSLGCPGVPWRPQWDVRWQVLCGFVKIKRNDPRELSGRGQALGAGSHSSSPSVPGMLWCGWCSRVSWEPQ